MPKENLILPDMLLSVFKKGYLCYFIAFCYVIIALMATFCLHCHTTNHTREKRGITTKCGNYCRECESENSCRVCENRTHLTEQSGIKTCHKLCPMSYHIRYSNVGKSTCVHCRIPHCISCDGSLQICHKCKRPYLLLKDIETRRFSCVRECPKGYRKHKRQRCLPKKVKATCKVSKWHRVPESQCNCDVKVGKWRMLIKTRSLIKRGEKCKKSLAKYRLCRPKRRQSCNISSSIPPQTKARRHRHNGTHRTNDSRSRTLKSDGRLLPKNSRSKYHKHKRRKHARNERTYNILSDVT